MLPDTAALRKVREALAPSSTLRAAINLSNFLLVSGRDNDGKPYGVAPDVAAEVGRRLDVPIEYVCFEKPDLLARAIEDGAWDIGLIGAEPARAQTIAFTSAYAEIECTYLVPPGSPIGTVADADRAGVRIASVKGAAYDLWLERNLKHAKLVEAKTLDESFECFRTQGLDALAGLRPRLISDAATVPGARVLDDCFASVQQAIGTRRGNIAGVQFLDDFVEEIRRSGFVAQLIKKHAVQGLSATRR